MPKLHVSHLVRPPGGTGEAVGRAPIQDPNRLGVTSSYYDELRQLQPEEDLIQLNSRPSSPWLRAQGNEVINGQTFAQGQAAILVGGTRDPRPERLNVPLSLLDLHESYSVDSPIVSSSGGAGAIQWVRPTREEQTVLIDVETSSEQKFESISDPFSGESCDQCDQRVRLDYCNVCNANLCSSCWDRQISHRKQRLAPGSIPHERTDYVIAQKIRATLEPTGSEEQRDDLHQEDKGTTWFGIVRDDGEFPLFQDYGRFARVMAEGPSSWSTPDPPWTTGAPTGARETRYPSLVSFVGDTGHGKSTIIKLLIDLNMDENNWVSSPVIGSAGEDVPTSADVHLYCEPLTTESDTPVLFADCEGLQGGERVPLGARFERRGKSSRSERQASFGQRDPQMQCTSEREITWADTTAKRSRQFAVSHLYPRLLYTFSDVVVFVLKNPRIIESVFEKLLDWGAAALEKSSNQPVLPHAVIVLNATDYDIPAELWDVAQSTRRILDSISRTVYHNATFKKYAQFWREREQLIETVEDLVYAYYSSVSIVRIPTSGRPKLIHGQIQKLRHVIISDCEEARRRKAGLRMLMNADELQPYLQYAFDHFACDLETPFDFVQVSFTNSPIPLDFGGNILKLALSLKEAWENQIDGEIVFKELSYMVASCIMLESARSKIRGVAERIFPEYREHLEAALENFCDRHWPCEYVKPGGGARCVNVRSGHGSKGHQLKNGKVFAVGDYYSHFSFEDYRETFIWDVYSRLDLLLKDLRKRMEGKSIDSEAQAAADLHRDTVMAHFYEHTSKDRVQSFISHSTCYSCLFEPPEHALPCGHILCTPCLKAYGLSRGKTVVELNTCPLETMMRPRAHSWRVMLKPSSAGVRILTLDGGGIRGIVELEALRQIERSLGGRLPIQSFFDIIVGTSTGGIIALGLGAMGWSVDESTRHFQELTRKAFTKRLGSGIPGVSWFVENHHHSKYETRPLEQALQSAFSEQEYLFGGPKLSKPQHFDIKVAVTGTSESGTPVVLSNYNRLCREKLLYHFQRPENLKMELKIWEAARATSAAPRYFKPFRHTPSKQVLLDGAIYHNNPINVADSERKLLWPALRNEHPDMILSIGTTYKATDNVSDDPQSPKSTSGIVSHGRSLFKIAVDHIATTHDSERTWQLYLGILQPPASHEHRYVRLNPQLDEEPPHLDQVENLWYIQGRTRASLSQSPVVEKIADQLIASSFYFEKTGFRVMEDESIKCSGHIYCRLPSDSPEISEVGRFLQTKMQLRQGVYFIARDEQQPGKNEYISINSSVVETMIKKCRFQLPKIEIRLSSKLVTTEILLFLGTGKPHPISRFPRSLLQDEDYNHHVRKAATPNSARWAGRTPSQSQRGTKWVPPDLTKAPPQRLGTISRYSEKDYVIGDSSRGRLQKIADRWLGRRAAADSASPTSPSSSTREADVAGKSELAGSTAPLAPLAELESSAATEELFSTSHGCHELECDPPAVMHELE